VGPRALLDVAEKRKIPSPHRESKPRTPIFQPVAQVKVKFSSSYSSSSSSSSSWHGIKNKNKNKNPVLN
jgi:hypothetical protein